jgi:hypothetical protein
MRSEYDEECKVYMGYYRVLIIVRRPPSFPQCSCNHCRVILARFVPRNSAAARCNKLDCILATEQQDCMHLMQLLN